MPDPSIPVPPTLSLREADVYRELVSKGSTAKDIARTLGCAPKTIENFKYFIMQKLKFKSVPQMIVWHYTILLPSITPPPAPEPPAS